MLNSILRVTREVATSFLASRRRGGRGAETILRTKTGIGARFRARRQNERVSLSGKLRNQTTFTAIAAPIVVPLATGV